ncbi:hypothetical protein NOC27_1331 [Nitrosococcus oceani AFC27]|nr:hypothetical protein NOC27_1331 [Nitrosococcus oceani AFC27]
MFLAYLVGRYHVSALGAGKHFRPDGVIGGGLRHIPFAPFGFSLVE